MTEFTKTIVYITAVLTRERSLSERERERERERFMCLEVVRSLIQAFICSKPEFRLCTGEYFALKYIN